MNSRNMMNAVRILLFIFLIIMEKLIYNPDRTMNIIVLCAALIIISTIETKQP